jgi:hypothetical protein
MFTFTQEVRPLSEQSHQVPSGEGPEKKPRQNPVFRLPNWRTTLPLAQSSPPLRGAGPSHSRLRAAGYAERPLPASRREINGPENDCGA